MSFFNVKNTATVNLISNLVLFPVKIIVALTYFNLSLLSDALNSLLDIVSAVIIMVTVKINNDPADSDHFILILFKLSNIRNSIFE